MKKITEVSFLIPGFLVLGLFLLNFQQKARKLQKQSMPFLIG